MLLFYKPHYTTLASTRLEVSMLYHLKTILSYLPLPLPSFTLLLL